METTFKEFVGSHEIMSLTDLADKLSTNEEALYEPTSEVKQAHVYDGYYYVLELNNGKFWTLVDRTDWTEDSLEAMLPTFYKNINEWL